MEQKVVLGGGCFWCTEAVFQRLRGVAKVESGYSGGHIKNPAYREVVSGRTGHAEVIEITYDPKEVSYGDIVKIHLTTHDPTTLNQQGADRGTQYRSIVFYKTPEEKAWAESAISEVQQSLDNPIVTEVAEFEAFYKAEGPHQNFYNSHPEQPYCQIVIDPKLDKFQRLYRDRMK